MEIRVRLVHAEGNQRIVHVAGYLGDRCLGSALGESSSAEEAEDRALERLRSRLQLPDPERQPSNHPQSPPSPRPESPPGPSPAPPAPPRPREEPPQDSGEPEDWSADLAQLDLLLRQLGWGKEDERLFLQRLFGHPSRGRLTRYADLQLLRRALEALPAGAQPGNAALPLRRSDLLSQCDGLLQQLEWTTDRAREALEHHFYVTSRQHLSDEQLLEFNLLLEGELLGPLQPV